MDKRKLSFILAFVLALTAVLMIRNYISQQEKRFIKEEKSAYVVVAVTNINAGTTIDESMIRFEKIPEKYVQPKAVSSQSLVVGKRVIADIFPGEQIMASKLTLGVRETSLAMRTPQGKRAITMTVSQLSAVGGKVRPGDYVDIIGLFPYAAQVDGRTISETVSVTLFQNVLILGIEGNAPPERGKPAPAPTDLVVTLALTPREIALLSYAIDQGRLRLVLRPPLETAVEPVPPVEVNTMWQYVFSNLGQEFLTSSKGPQKPLVTQQQQINKSPEPPPPPTLEIYRGTEKSKMVIK